MDKKRRLEEIPAAEKQVTLRKFLAPLPTDKLVDILVKIGSENDFAYDQIEKVANEDLTQRKLFVHGLPWEIKKEELVGPFSRFGAVAETTVVMDPSTGRGKGFGFVTYQSMADAYKALAEGSIEVGGRTVMLKLAALKTNPVKALEGNEGPEGGRSDTTMRKLFVRGLLSHHGQADLEALFAPYGELEEAKVTTDRHTGESKGYGFVTYTSARAAAAALEEPAKEYHGRTIHCKLAALGAQGSGAQGGGGRDRGGAGALGGRGGGGGGGGGYSGLGVPFAGGALGAGGGFTDAQGPMAQAAAARRQQQLAAGYGAYDSQAAALYGAVGGANMMGAGGGYGGMSGMSGMYGQGGGSNGGGGWA